MSGAGRVGVEWRGDCDLCCESSGRAARGGDRGVRWQGDVEGTGAGAGSSSDGRGTR